MSSSITGSAVTYAYGGGHGSNTTPGSGGTGSTVGPGGAGQAGLVVFRYRGPQQATGGVITTVGDDTVHTFTTSGVLQVY